MRKIWRIGVPVLDEKGSLLGYRGADIDITERRQVKGLLRKGREELKKRIKELEEFHAGAVARELGMAELKEEIARLKEEKERLKKELVGYENP